MSTSGSLWSADAAVLQPLPVALPNTSGRPNSLPTIQPALTKAVWHAPDYTTLKMPLPFLAAMSNSELKEVSPNLVNALEQQFSAIAESFDTQSQAVAQGFNFQNKEIGKLHGQLWNVATSMEMLNERNVQLAQGMSDIQADTKSILDSLNGRGPATAPVPTPTKDPAATAAQAFYNPEINPSKPLSFAEPRGAPGGFVPTDTGAIVPVTGTTQGGGDVENQASSGCDDYMGKSYAPVVESNQMALDFRGGYRPRTVYSQGLPPSPAFHWQ